MRPWRSNCTGWPGGGDLDQLGGGREPELAGDHGPATRQLGAVGGRRLADRGGGAGVQLAGDGVTGPGLGAPGGRGSPWRVADLVLAGLMLAAAAPPATSARP